MCRTAHANQCARYWACPHVWEQASQAQLPGRRRKMRVPRCSLTVQRGLLHYGVCLLVLRRRRKSALGHLDVQAPRGHAPETCSDSNDEGWIGSGTLAWHAKGMELLLAAGRAKRRETCTLLDMSHTECPGIARQAPPEGCELREDALESSSLPPKAPACAEYPLRATPTLSCISRLRTCRSGRVKLELHTGL